MPVKGLKIIKCTNCGKTTLLDEYEINGCAGCNSHDHGVDYRSYKNREHLAEFEGVQVFNGIYHKVGHLFRHNNKCYALISNVTCGTKDTFTNHMYVQDVSPKSYETLKTLKPGTPIQFNASTRMYDARYNRWGLHRMHDIVLV